MVASRLPGAGGGGCWGAPPVLLLLLLLLATAGLSWRKASSRLSRIPSGQLAMQGIRDTAIRGRRLPGAVGPALSSVLGQRTEQGQEAACLCSEQPTTTLGTTTATIPAAPECGKPQRLNRIVGGQDSGDAEWPWVVSISKNGSHHCAGSLLSSRWVVTAAHCFKGDLDKPSLFSVLLGAWRLQTPGPRSQRVGIAWVLPHPQYPWKEAAPADIALVRLAHPVQFSERVLPICLPDTSVRLPPNTDCWIAGWGSVSDGVFLPQPQTLQKLKVPIIDAEVCSRLYWRGAGPGAITDDMLCAGYLEGQRDACLGDSGGPLMCQADGAWLLAGLISWGEGCAERDRPGVYTSLLAHRSWVQRVAQGVQLRGRSQGN